MKVSALVMLAALVMSACGGKSQNPVVTVCKEDGQRCRMGGSKLGVCMGQPDGSYQCADQH